MVEGGIEKCKVHTLASSSTSRLPPPPPPPPPPTHTQQRRQQRDKSDVKRGASGQKDI